MMYKIVKIFKILKLIILVPVELIWLLVYFTSSQKKKIDMDIERFARHQQRPCTDKTRWILLILNLMWVAEFRKLFLFRIGGAAVIMRFMMAKGTAMGFDVPREKFGGGFYIQHGHGTVISAQSVGEHCMINQLVTIGYKGNGCPTIGNNVRIGTGAIIIGDVKIGDNVNIGAGAIVVHDVPDNCTVCCPEATIVKRRDPQPSVE